jgi:hypothetical protein
MVNRKFAVNSGTFWNMDPINNIERRFIVTLNFFLLICPSFYSAFESLAASSFATPIYRMIRSLDAFSPPSLVMPELQGGQSHPGSHDEGFSIHRGLVRSAWKSPRREKRSPWLPTQSSHPPQLRRCEKIKELACRRLVMTTLVVPSHASWERLKSSLQFFHAF